MAPTLAVLGLLLFFETYIGPNMALGLDLFRNQQLHLIRYCRLFQQNELNVGEFVNNLSQCD